MRYLCAINHDDLDQRSLNTPQCPVALLPAWENMHTFETGLSRIPVLDWYLTAHLITPSSYDSAVIARGVSGLYMRDGILSDSCTSDRGSERCSFRYYRRALFIHWKEPIKTAPCLSVYHVCI